MNSGKSGGPPDGRSDWLQELQDEQQWIPPDPSKPLEMRATCDSWWDDYIELSQVQDEQELTLTQELSRLLILTRTLAQTAETHGIDATALITFLSGAEGVYYGHQPRLPVAGPPIHVLLDRLRLKLSGLIGPTATTSPTPASSVSPPERTTPPSGSVPVELRGSDAEPLVFGNPVPPLTVAQYNTIQALLRAGPSGLTKDLLDKKSGHSEARKFLSDLARRHPDTWGKVIKFPRTKGRGGYRIEA